MSIKQKAEDKNKTSEIDDHIRRSFDIRKVTNKFIHVYIFISCTYGAVFGLCTKIAVGG